MIKEALQYMIGLGGIQSINPSEEKALLIPDGMSPHSLEKFAPGRFRERYKFVTSSMDDFCTYVRESQERTESTIKLSVNPDTMSARALLNAQSHGLPGHCDDTATCILKGLPFYKELDGIGADGVKLSQRQLLDWLQDWHGDIVGATEIHARFSKVTVESASHRSSEEQDFGRNRTAMEKIDVKAAGEPPPAFIRADVLPFDGFSMYPFQIRVSAIADKDKDSVIFKLRIPLWESMKMAIGRDFVGAVKDRLSSSDDDEQNVAVYIGEIQAS